MIFQFKGTPQQLWETIERFVHQSSEKKDSLPVTLSKKERHDEDSHSMSIRLVAPQGEFISATAATAPNGTTTLFVYSDPLSWSLLGQLWADLMDEMQNQGWVDSPWPTSKTVWIQDSLVCEYTLPIGLDELSAGTTQWITLPTFPNDFVEFALDSTVPGMIVFKLSNKDYGDIGEIRLRKISDKWTHLSICTPHRPTEEEELEYVLRSNGSPVSSAMREYLDRRAQLQLQGRDIKVDLLSSLLDEFNNPASQYSVPEVLAVWARHTAAGDELFNRRCEHLNLVIHEYFIHLRHDAVWKLAGAIQTRSSESTAEQAATTVAGSPAKTEIISMNQSGGITAQNVIIQGDKSQTTLRASEPPKVKKLIWRVVVGFSVIVGILASIVKILEFFRISLF